MQRQNILPSGAMSFVLMTSHRNNFCSSLDKTYEQLKPPSILLGANVIKLFYGPNLLILLKVTVFVSENPLQPSLMFKSEARMDDFTL